MRLDRLIYILLTLEKKKKVTAKWLADELETSVRTIYRDIDTLCAAGIPICTESGQGGGISLVEGYQTQIKHLDKEDIIYLFLNGMGVKAEKGSRLDQHADVSLKKIANSLPDMQAEEIQEIVDRFVVDRSPWWGEGQAMGQIDTILQAVFQLHKLCFKYQKVDLEISNRIIRPYGIVIKENIWYVVGYCEASFDIRMFRCDRMKQCELLDETFLYPMNFNLKEYFNNALKAFKEKCAFDEQYLVTMTVKEQAFRYLKDMEYSVLWKMDDLWRICVNLYSYEDAMNDHWSLLINAYDIEPVALRSSIYEKLKAYLKTIDIDRREK